MSKKNEINYTTEIDNSKNKLNIEKQLPPEIAKLPEDARKKYEALQKKLEEFKDKLLNKFGENLKSVSLLPPHKEDSELSKEENEKLKKKINILVLMDDSDSKKMTKEQLKEKLVKHVLDMAEGIDKEFNPNTLLVSELWQTCYDSKTEILKSIAMSSTIYDTGLLDAIKISEIHKEMVLKKFEKYIVAYVLAGSIVQGKATKDSDIDVFLVIDDTDVKKMTRMELRDKLRMIILGMGMEAGEMTGIRNKINIQVYILTDFWDYIKEASPVIFTFLRDGVPLYDRGIFMPWKQLLQMGRIKPSGEAIEMFMNSGEQMLSKVKDKIKEIGLEDTFWAILTPSQAALMLYGLPPPTPKEAAGMIRDVFVKKEKILEEKYVKILENNIKVRKDIEHGTKKTLTGKELDKLLQDSEDYLNRIKKLFENISKLKEAESLKRDYDNVISLARDALKSENINKKISESNVPKVFSEELVHKGVLPETCSSSLKKIIKINQKEKLTTLDIKNLSKETRNFIKIVLEYLQRKQKNNFDAAKIKIKNKEEIGELIFTKTHIFFVKNVETQEMISKVKNKTSKFIKSNVEELEKSTEKINNLEAAHIDKDIFKLITTFFGTNVEIKL